MDSRTPTASIHISSPISTQGANKVSRKALPAALGCFGFFCVLGLQALLFQEFLSAQGLRVGVEAEEDGFVDERVLLLRPGTLLELLAGRTHDGLDLVAVDQAGDIGVGDLSGGENVVPLVQRRLVKGAKDVVKEFECALGPDDETAKVSTRSELQEVESRNVNEFDTGQVSEGLDDPIVFVIDDQRATTLAVATVAHLALTSTQLPGVGNLEDISVGVQGLEEGHGLFGLFEGLGGGCDYKGNFFEFFDAMATCENERGEGRGGEGRDNGKPALVLVYLDVPFAPGLGRGKHAASTTHVSECSLSRTVGSSTTNTGDTCDGTTGTPRLCTSLVSGLFTYGISLSLVLCDALVDLLDDIEPDGCGQNGRERKGRGRVARSGTDVDGRS